MKKLIYSQEDLNLILSLEMDKLQSNWNSLREWVEHKYNIIAYEDSAYIFVEEVLDKMNELEGVDNENN